MVRECQVNEKKREEDVTTTSASLSPVPTPPAHNFLDLIITNLLASIVGTMGIWLDAPFSFAHKSDADSKRIGCFFSFHFVVAVPHILCFYLNAGSASRTRDENRERGPRLLGAIARSKTRQIPGHTGREKTLSGAGYCTCGHAPYHTPALHTYSATTYRTIWLTGNGSTPAAADRRAEREPWPMFAHMDTPVCLEPHNLYIIEVENRKLFDERMHLGHRPSTCGSVLCLCWPMHTNSLMYMLGVYRWRPAGGWQRHRHWHWRTVFLFVCVHG